jgi:opacity protein-like surface antigen
MRTSLLLGVSAACIAIAAPATAQVQFKPYVEIGLFSVGKMEASDAHSGGTMLSESAEDGNGISLGLKDFVGPFDIRLDAYDSEIYDPAVNTYLAEINVNSWYLDVLYTHEIADRLELYAGGGAGQAELTYSGCSFCLPTVLVEGDDRAFSWQAIAGARFNLVSGLGVFVEGRYMSADGFEITETPSQPPDPLLTVNYPTDYKEFVVLSGVRWQF